MSDTNLVASGTIAIIIPTYNQEAYLVEAVESVFAQSRLPDQVVLVNDGSTDGTSSVAGQLCQQHPTIIYLSQGNAGVGRACQAGLEKVTADYVVRLDGDDTMPPSYLEALSQALVGQPDRVAFAYSSAKLFGADGGWIQARPWSVGRLAPENYIHVSSLVRTSVAREVGYFAPELNGYEDWDFYLTLADHGYRGILCRETFLNYRQKPEGGRNTMTREKDRDLRSQIYARHPKIYRNPLNKLQIFRWRVGRRLGYWSKRMRNSKSKVF